MATREVRFLVTSIDEESTPTAVAPLGRRALARAVDLATVFAWTWALSVAHVLYYVPRLSDDVAPDPWGRYFLIGMSIAAVALVYEVAFVSRTGATPGKDLMHLRVVDVATGARPSAGQALRRALPLGAAWIVPGIWGAVPITAAIGATAAPSTERRGIHDLLAGTAVVTAVDVLPEGQTAEEAAAERRSHFIPRFVDPIQVLPSQIFRHPGAPRPGGPGAGDAEPPTR